MVTNKGELTDKIAYLENENAELKEELKKWKDEWQEQVQKAIDEGWERTKLTGRVRELEEQIEKMKCCQNCKSEDNDYMKEPCRSCSRCLGDIKRKGTSDKWEIKEE